MKPVCAKCNCEMRPHTNGVTVVTHAHTPPVPYEAWMADLWWCPTCGARVVTGYAERPFAHHSVDSERFAEIVDAAERADKLINVWERDGRGLNTPWRK